MWPQLSVHRWVILLLCWPSIATRSEMLFVLSVQIAMKRNRQSSHLKEQQTCSQLQIRERGCCDLAGG